MRLADGSIITRSAVSRRTMLKYIGVGSLAAALWRPHIRGMGAADKTMPFMQGLPEMGEEIQLQFGRMVAATDAAIVETTGLRDVINERLERAQPKGDEVFEQVDDRGQQYAVRLVSPLGDPVYREVPPGSDPGDPLEGRTTYFSIKQTWIAVRVS